MRHPPTPFWPLGTPFVPQQTSMGPASTSKARCAKRQPKAQKCELTEGCPAIASPRRWPWSRGRTPRAGRRRTECVVESMVKPSASDGIYRPTKLAAVVDTLSEDGVSPEEVLRGVGVGADELRSPDTLISLEQLLAGCKNAIRLSRDPSLPFRIGSMIHVSAYGMYGYAILCSTDFRKTFDFCVKYHVLAAPLVTFSFSERAWLRNLDHRSHSASLGRPAAVQIYRRNADRRAFVPSARRDGPLLRSQRKSRSRIRGPTTFDWLKQRPAASCVSSSRPISSSSTATGWTSRRSSAT